MFLVILKDRTINIKCLCISEVINEIDVLKYFEFQLFKVL